MRFQCRRSLILPSPAGNTPQDPDPHSLWNEQEMGGRVYPHCAIMHRFLCKSWKTDWKLGVSKAVIRRKAKKPESWNSSPAKGFQIFPWCRPCPYYCWGMPAQILNASKVVQKSFRGRVVDTHGLTPVVLSLWFDRGRLVGRNTWWMPINSLSPHFDLKNDESIRGIRALSNLK